MHRVPGQFPRKWRSRVWLNIQLNVIPHRVSRQYSMYGKRGGRGLIFKWTLYRTVFHVSSPCKGKEMGVVKYSKECQQCHWPQFHAQYSKNVVLPSILKSEVHTRLRGWGVTGQGGGGRRGGGECAVVFCGYLYYTLFQIALHSVSVHTTVRRKAWLRVWWCTGTSHCTPSHPPVVQFVLKIATELQNYLLNQTLQLIF